MKAAVNVRRIDIVNIRDAPDSMNSNPAEAGFELTHITWA